MFMDLDFQHCQVQAGRQASDCNNLQLRQRGFKGGGLCQRDQWGETKLRIFLTVKIGMIVFMVFIPGPEAVPPALLH